MKIKINQGRDFKYQYVYQVESRLDKKKAQKKWKTEARRAIQGIGSPDECPE